MTVFDDIKSGLEQASQYENGQLKARKVTLSVAPVAKFTPAEIKAIRQRTGFTQVVFAKYLGVSSKTVEAWEAGKNRPEGAACRLLAMTHDDPAFPLKSGIVARSS